MASSSAWSDVGPDGSPVYSHTNSAYVQEEYTLEFHTWAAWTGGFKENEANSLAKGTTKPVSQKYTIPAQIFEDDTLVRKERRGPDYNSPRFEEYCKHFYTYMKHIYTHAQTTHGAGSEPEFVELRIFRSRKVYRNFELPNQVFCKLGKDTSNDFVCTIGVKISNSETPIVKIFKLAGSTITPLSSPAVPISAYNLKMHAVTSVIFATPNKKRSKGTASIHTPVSKSYINCEAVWRPNPSAGRNRLVVTGFMQILQQSVIGSMVVDDMATGGMSPPE
jgi:hypothetical protein